MHHKRTKQDEGNDLASGPVHFWINNRRLSTLPVCLNFFVECMVCEKDHKTGLKKSIEPQKKVQYSQAERMHNATYCSRVGHTSVSKSYPLQWLHIGTETVVQLNGLDRL